MKRSRPQPGGDPNRWYPHGSPLGPGAKGCRGDVPPPVGFGWAPPFRVYETSQGIFRTTIDWDALVPAYTDEFWVSTGGNNGNTGLSHAQAWLSIDVALANIAAAGNPTRLNIEGGEYTNSHRWDSTLIANDFYAVGYGGRPVTISRPNAFPAWTADGASYKAAVAAVQVIDNADTQADGFGLALELVANAAAVMATPRSFFEAAGTTWVHTFDSREPDTDVDCVLNVNGTTISAAGKTHYYKGIEFRSSGAACVNVVAAGNIILDDCWLTFAKSGSCLDCDDVTGIVYLRDCVAVQATDDGFNYATTPYAVEVNCNSYRHGPYEVANNQNGSSMHGGGVIVRVGGIYSGAKGPGIADVTAGDTWCLGCQALDSVADLGVNANDGFKTDGDMWLDRCIASGNESDIAEDGAGTAYHHESTYTTSRGTLAAYNNRP